MIPAPIGLPPLPLLLQLELLQLLLLQRLRLQVFSPFLLGHFEKALAARGANAPLPTRAVWIAVRGSVIG